MKISFFLKEEYRFWLFKICGLIWRLIVWCLQGIVWIWAVGALPIRFPEHMGIVMGDESARKYLLMETHYDNPEQKVGIVDSSGLNVVMTRKLRPTNAGFFAVGTLPSNLLSSFNVVWKYLIVTHVEIWWNWLQRKVEIWFSQVSIENTCWNQDAYICRMHAECIEECFSGKDEGVRIWVSCPFHR